MLAVRRVSPDLADHATIRTALAHASQVAVKVAHENIVHCHGLYSLDGVGAQISEAPPQLELELMMRHKIDPRLSTWIIRQLAEAIIHAESLTVSHNNIMPRHIYASADGVVRLDFGVMRSVSSGPDQTSIAGIGDAAYEPVFMKDGKPHPPSDVYSLACIWFELLTQRRYSDLLREKRGIHPLATSFAPQLPASINHALARALDGAARDPFLDAKSFSATLARIFYVDLDASDEQHGSNAIKDRARSVLGVSNEPPETRTTITDPEAAPARGTFTQMLEERARPVEPRPLTSDDHDSSDVVERNRSTWAPGISIPAGQNPLGPQPVTHPLLLDPTPAAMSTFPSLGPSVSTQAPLERPEVWPTWMKWFLLGFVLTFLGLRVLHG
jgi:serine/threonine protein kinase